MDNYLLEQYMHNLVNAGQERDVEETLDKRGDRYGDYRDVSGVSQDIKAVFTRSKNWYKMEPFMQESLHMIANKLGRILSGDIYYDDSWHDISGYATLVVKQLERK
ncbi:MAG: hypothetical protein ACO22M_00545 [Candidatus Nanopelagicaceae bacterium]